MKKIMEVSRKLGRFLKKRLDQLRPARFCSKQVDAPCQHEEWCPIPELIPEEILPLPEKAVATAPPKMPTQQTKVVEYIVSMPGMATKVGMYVPTEDEELISTHVAG